MGGLSKTKKRQSSRRGLNEKRIPQPRVAVLSAADPLAKSAFIFEISFARARAGRHSLVKERFQILLGKKGDFKIKIAFACLVPS